MGSQDQTSIVDCSGLRLIIFGQIYFIMFSKLVSLSCLALASAQVGIIGSPEWQAYKNAELAHIAPSVGPLAAQGVNHAQQLLAWEQQNLIHTQNALNFVASGAGRRKRQVQVEGSAEWQAYKNAELAFISPSVGPAPINFAQSQLNHVGPAPGPDPALSYAQQQLNYQQQALNFIANGGR